MDTKYGTTNFLEDELRKLSKEIDKATKEVQVSAKYVKSDPGCLRARLNTLEYLEHKHCIMTTLQEDMAYELQKHRHKITEETRRTIIGLKATIHEGLNDRFDHVNITYLEKAIELLEEK